MGEAELLDGAAEELRRDFSGKVLDREDSGYDEARSVFNAMIDRRPALIAQSESAADVAAALALARDRGLDVAVRSGGHSVAGAGVSEGGLVIDMRRMNDVSVDPEARIATAAGGATWSDFDRATQPHGLMSTGGRVSTTGVAGLTLGGGSGWLERRFGLACDALESVTLVTADGEIVTASEDENPELFWALHGGGGNFGVATELRFRLSPLPAATFGLLVWPPDRGLEVAHRYRDLIEGGPKELGGGLAYITGPPEEFVPEQLQGRLVAAAIVVYAGPEEEAREAIAPLLELRPEGEMLAEMPYAEIQCAIDDPPGLRNYWSAEHLASLPDEALELWNQRAADMIVPSASQHILFPAGGAVGDEDRGWPLPWRDAPWVVHPFGLWDTADQDEQGIAWARAVCADMKPFATGDLYLNFVGNEGEDRLVAGYGRENYDRLAAVKAEYDPGNVFNLHHNIKPAR
ncbi:MAG TPA: FAD-binding oxidoreductase [Solirubrobacterales bacterium]|jgi:FAD/FMN-containing dehydrogenase|nr:FAD-binding oxidoreductase [Solirubrobacterales bacterium]